MKKRLRSYDSAYDADSSATDSNKKQKQQELPDQKKPDQQELGLEDAWRKLDQEHLVTLLEGVEEETHELYNKIKTQSAEDITEVREKLQSRNYILVLERIKVYSNALCRARYCLLLELRGRRNIQPNYRFNLLKVNCSSLSTSKSDIIPMLRYVLI